VFSSVGHRIGGWDGVAVLDLFAGSGALGLEAASRGAGAVLLVERDRQVLPVLRRNVATVGCPCVQVLAADSYRLQARSAVMPTQPPADVLFCDPPYRDAQETVAELLGRLVQRDWLAPDALAVVERSARDEPFGWPPQWQALTDRRHADTHVYLAGLVPSAQTP
jgi:16S rRNA (guanine966-N2)-methyltransferase